MSLNQEIYKVAYFTEWLLKSTLVIVIIMIQLFLHVMTDWSFSGNLNGHTDFTHSFITETLYYKLEV